MTRSPNRTITHAISEYDLAGMKLSYRHANVGAGNESFLLRYQSESRTNGAACVLVDAGADIALSELLGPADDLVALCLTHAHSDHYQSLGDCVREETTVYASPPTAAVFPDVIEIAAHQTDMATIRGTDKVIQPIDSWTDLAPGVSVHPVPAGHAPGAVGYLFQFADGTDTRHVLATGDFTRRRAAGYPGFDTSLEEIDVLFCTVATDENFEPHLSEGLGRALHRSHSGAPTLVATSGLLGVQVAYLLNELAIEFAHSVEIRPVGHVATLYNGMNYDCRHVDPVEVFDDPTECLNPGTITVAGPDVPTEGSSGRLFHRLRGNPNACVIQLHNSAGDAVNGGQCSVHSYETINHPPYDDLAKIHDEIAPIHTVIVHQHGGAGSEFNDLDSCVWAPTNDEEYTLYADGWQTPPSRDNDDFGDLISSSGSLKAQVEFDLVEALTLPEIARYETPDLPAEGIDLERVASILNQTTASTDSEATQRLDPTHPSARYRQRESTDEQPTASSTASSPDPAETDKATDETPDTTHMSERDETSTAESSDQIENQDTDSESPYHRGLTDSISGTADEIDPRIRKAIASGDLDPSDLATFLKVSGEVESPNTDDGEADRATSDREDSAENPDKDDGNSPGDARTDSDTDSADYGQSKTEKDQTPDKNMETESQAEPQSDTSGPATKDQVNVQLELSALTAALANHAVDTDEAETVSDVVYDAVLAFIESFLAGSVEPSKGSLAGSLSTTTGPLADALQTIAAGDSTVDNVEALVIKSVGQYLDGEHQIVTVPGLQPYLSLLDAVVENDAVGAASRAEVIAYAVQYHIAQQHNN